MRKLISFFALTRPVNVLLCFISAACGAVIAYMPFDSENISTIISSPLWKIFLAAVSSSLILAAGNVYNDIMDISCDRINAPERPVSSGSVTVLEATFFYFLLTFSGMAISVPLGYKNVVVAFSAVVLLWAYNRSLKGIPLLGNASVAFLGGLVFLYGGLAVKMPERALIPSIFAFLYHFGREIVKDIQDYEGDSISGVRTSSTVWGKKKSAYIASGLFSVLLPVIFVPYIIGYFGVVYITAVSAGVATILIYSIVSLFVGAGLDKIGFISKILKIGMGFGLISIFLGFQFL